MPIDEFDAAIILGLKEVADLCDMMNGCISIG